MASPPGAPEPVSPYDEAAALVPLSADESLGGAVGRSLAPRSLFAKLDRAALTDETVLPLGGSGAGKEVLACALRAEHRGGRPAIDRRSSGAAHHGAISAPRPEYAAGTRGGRGRRARVGRGRQARAGLRHVPGEA